MLILIFIEIPQIVELPMGVHMVQTAIQQHLPRRRTGHTTSVTIGGERFYLTANGCQDGTLGEVFISRAMAPCGSPEFGTKCSTATVTGSVKSISFRNSSS